ncbi:MAG: enoyl-[acyl-carrier-protein] reductase FabK [Lachnospiraceae bacterium]|nr:enoyl-[acyl-carrier-protein] reductase FabK [Lachnospiraceae bacterium]
MSETVWKDNPVCKMLGIDYPVLQGGMAWIADAELAAAVSNAGGLGLIAAMNSNGEQLRAQIRKAKGLTDRPFGVNLMLMSPYIEEAVDTVCDEHVGIVTTGAGNPAKYMDKLKEAGVKVICVVASVALAVMAERMGACAVVAEGCESGGHVGETTTMALVPQVVDAVNIPVIAAGGIADGRGMAASFLLGASAIQMGTRFLTATECNVHANYKAKVLAAKDHDTIVTGLTLGHPVRALKNAMTREFRNLERDPQTRPEELEAMGAGALRRAAIEGDVKNGSCMCGQIAGLVKTEDSCADIVHGVCREAGELLCTFGLYALGKASEKLLSGKTAVITGGTRGIGLAIARIYAENGADLALIATKKSNTSEETADELRKFGGKVELYACDVREQSCVEETAAQILANFGHVDILVNNAGITKDGLLTGFQGTEIDDVIDVNLKGTIYMTKALIRQFVRQRSGVIVNISSVVGMMGNSGQTNYAASKAGIIGFTKAVAKEYGRRNIRCNAIAPGFIKTDMTASLDETAAENYVKQLPVGRPGDPRDVAELALFLASGKSSYITGEIMKVDGGMYV